MVITKMLLGNYGAVSMFHISRGLEVCTSDQL